MPKNFESRKYLKTFVFERDYFPTYASNKIKHFFQINFSEVSFEILYPMYFRLGLVQIFLSQAKQS